MFETDAEIQESSAGEHANPSPSAEPKAGPPEPGKDWRAGLPSEYADAPALKDIPDIQTLAKNYVHAQRHIGASIRKPGEDAGPEDWQKYFQKVVDDSGGKLMPTPDPNDEVAMAAFQESLGIPKDPASYDVDEGVEVNSEWLEQVKAQAKEYGLTKGNFKRFVKNQVEAQKAKAEENQKIQQADLAELSKEWGHATEHRLAEIARFAKSMGFDENFIKAIQDKQMGSHLLKPLWTTIEQMGGLSEGREVSYQRDGRGPASPAEKEEQIREIMANPSYLDPRDPRQRGLVQKVVQLREEIDSIRQSN